MAAYDWICPKVPENLRDHRRSNTGECDHQFPQETITITIF